MNIAAQLSEAASLLAGVATDKSILQAVEQICTEVISCLKRGNKILAAGNGGSAADAQHFAAELVGRFKKERAGLPAIALTTDTSAITAIANDYGFDQVFARQVEALGSEGDLLFLFSTSGNSENLVKAAATAKQRNIKTVGFVGKDGGKLRGIVDISIVVPSNNTARIQEVHQVFYHIVCQELEAGI